MDWNKTPTLLEFIVLVILMTCVTILVNVYVLH
jgi:hypothetical protein